MTQLVDDHEDGFLTKPGVTLLVIAVLVKRLGGAVVVSQGDIDGVAYGQLIEGEGPGLLLRFEDRAQQ